MADKNEVLTMKIVGYIDKILRYSKDMDSTAFLSDTKLVEACVFNLLQIGELAYRYDETYMQAHPNIPWRKIRGLRNRLVHDYEGVNLVLVWDIIGNDLVSLRNNLAK
jgi:uncharacterized protein with HEPN domain